MAKRQHRTKPQPEVSSGAPPRPAALPDVASQPHPTSPTEPPNGSSVRPAGTDHLQKVLPEINKVAQKVGGFKKLSEIADTLARTKE